MEKILVIDDSPVQSGFLSSILADDYESTICHTAEEGLEAAKEGGYSLILLDVVMPGMDGFTLLKKLQDDNATKNVPVILITSLGDMAHEEQGLTMGAVDYIAKPFHPRSCGPGSTPMSSSTATAPRWNSSLWWTP